MPNYDVHKEQDRDGRWHIWLRPRDPKKIPSADDVYAEARKIVKDFASREFDISQEMLTAGAFHLREKGFDSKWVAS